MKKLVTMFLTLVLCVGAICVPASAYYTEVSEMTYVTPSNSSIGTTTCTRTDEGGKTHTVYIFPAGTTFDCRSDGTVLMIYAWTLESLNNRTAGYFNSGYAYLANSYDSPDFVPEPGVVYLLEETNTMDFAQDMYIMVEGGASQSETPEEPEETTEPEPSASPFGDVAESAYYYDPVLWAVEEGITTGRSATSFAPNDTCTEANILTFLWRAYGEPAPKTTENPFGTAVNTGSYYYDAALWAYEQGMIDETFDPNTACTRSQAVYFMWVAAGSPDDAAAASFTDVAADASYADAVNWAVAQGVTTGRTASTFAPDDTCTRGNIVTFLYRDLAE